MILAKAFRRFVVLGLLAVSLTTSAFAAMPASAKADAIERTGPPGGEKSLSGVGSPEEVEVGRKIYREGIGANGKPILGVRFGGVELEGAMVACVSCHRRSGLGSVEGTDLVPPIAGRFIYSDDAHAVVTMNFRNIKNFNQTHQPFDEQSFASAVRQGRHISGRDLSTIMPRFELTDAELRGLSSYLRTLSAKWSPGVDMRTIHLATVITPDVSPQRKKAFLETMKAAVNQKNGNFLPGQRGMATAAEMLFNTSRFWDLEVWELHGEPQTWAAQLEEFYRAKPVFALVSGLGAGQWMPVHDFCERQQVACWFPSVDAPPARANEDFYSLYFSSGVQLEADVIAHQLEAEKPARLIQLHRGDSVGRAGAEQLATALGRLKKPIPVVTRTVASTDSAGLAHALADLGPKDTLMMWWPAADIPALEAVAAPKGMVYFSGRMAGGERAPLPVAWKSAIHMVYPYQLPEKRAASLFYFNYWLNLLKIEVQDEPLQSEVYFALTYLSETLTEMLDNLHREYLLERAENMLSLRESMKAEDEARDMSVAKYNKGGAGGAQAAMAKLATPEARKSPRPMPGQVAHVMAKRESTTLYPRLSLAPGQRFASKGAYIVRFAGDGKSIEAESEWIVP
jgi:hypothetical protein